ncbi:MAG: sugar transferase, partial [Clostridiales bacterium]|nr:sugar transferase [Clostridiales bacterium]
MTKKALPVLPYWSGPLSHPFYSFVIKRLFDFLFSLILLPFALVLILPLSIWIKLDSKGPVFYQAPRGGYHNRPFYILKFRTMVIDADQFSGTTALEDSRITSAG